MGTPSIPMQEFLRICIHEPKKLGNENLFENVLIPNFNDIEEIEINPDGTIDQEGLRSYDIQPYVGFKQFYAKVMVPHAVYSRQILEKKDLTSKLVTTDDEALALVIMENCVEKWNAEYEIRRKNALKHVRDTRNKNHKRTSGNDNCTEVTPEKRARTTESEQRMVSGTPGLTTELNKEGNTEQDNPAQDQENDDSEEDDSEHEKEVEPETETGTDANMNTEYNEGSLECLKGILQKHLLSKQEKKQLPLTKFTEQRQDRLKIIIGWEGPGLERFMIIKESLVNFQGNNDLIMVEIDKQSVANMAAELQTTNEEKQQQVSQYAKSEKEKEKKKQIEKIYNNTKLSPFATTSENRVWEL